MAREKKEQKPEGVPAWLVTFSDMMTLMLTFFVLLVSMSVMDERRKLVVLGSIVGTFGLGRDSYEVLSTQDKKRSVEPGPIETESTDDLEPLKALIWEDANEDLNFSSNRFVQVFSIADDVLFEPGGAILKPQGRQLLERALPVLFSVEYPILLAGHTSSLRDEEGTSYRVEDRGKSMDDSWRLSFARVMGIYRFLIEAGMDPAMLRVEAFGRYHPRYSELTAKDRRKNRRVDIILDKRNAKWLDRLGPTRKDAPSDEFRYKDFIFRFERRGMGQ
ncbi:chemotaxis protein MotB [Desulfobaculum xiamenense]|uniref:Chemotaxis protein MotB n=1 Tax=Desulfobaculum xiamenense TaxID=995050 RepID=A0A846QNB0_9BACT|nr:flagellar motor protein MotB [Desulfobaculum xiamenense]NJB67942.1 chemotaxis protein MotB [Desulfobaculum xiamenense]